MQLDGSKKANRDKDAEQQEFGVSNGATHNTKYPFLQEFSELLHSLSTKELESLLTPVQKKMAVSLWEAENYGGSIEKAKKRLEDIYGKHWFRGTNFKDHFTLLKDYFISTLIADHKSQWDKKHKETQIKKIAKINQENT